MVRVLFLLCLCHIFGLSSRICAHRLASSGSEGGPNMGAMRYAQTANYGVLPNPSMPNTFVAQVKRRHDTDCRQYSEHA